MCVYGSTKRHKFLTLNCTDDTFLSNHLSPNFSGTWKILIVYFSKMLKENLRNWFSFRSTRAKFGKCLIRNFLYLRELDTTKRQINKTCFWWIVYIYYDMVLQGLFTRRLAQHWRLVTPNFTWLWLSCWMYYFEAIKRLQNSLFFRRVKLDHWSLFGLVMWAQTMGLRV